MPKEQKTRAQMDARFLWKLEDIYPTDQAWEEDFQKAKPAAARVAAFAGKLEQQLPEALCALEEAELLLTRLYAYARMRRDEDNGNTTYQGLADRAQSLAVELGAATAYFGPEVLALGREKVEAVLRAHPELERFRRLLEGQLRLEAHTLGKAEETLLAQAGEMASAPDTIYSMLTDADMKFGFVTGEDGEKVELTHGRFIPLLQSPDRAVRKEAYETYYAAYRGLTNAIAATYSASVKKDIFFAKARGYASSREESLFENEIPEGVYDALIEAVHRHLPAMHRYLALRKKALQLPELRFYDIYAPIVPDVQLGLPYEEACKLVLEGLAPLGETYIQDLRRAFTDGWIDVYENPGKRSGAYSAGARVHPYVLLNYTGTLDSQFTLAHEMGHAIHSYLSNRTQPVVYADYVIFVAEVASTCNEALLMEHLLSRTSDKQQRAYLLNHFLEQFKGTLYRQTMFAEFELLLGRLNQAGQALTAERLCQEYLALNRQYFGDGIVIDPAIALEWARIPHFYYNYYVFQYATGYAAAIALSRRILREGKPAVEDYLRFLSGGCSQDPIDLLKIAGVDMSSPVPVQQALDLFGQLLDEMEAL